MLLLKRLTPEKHDSRAMRQRRYGKTALFLSIIHGLFVYDNSFHSGKYGWLLSFTMCN